jgi:hypothetical protein
VINVKVTRVGASECGQRGSFNWKTTVSVVSDEKRLACRSWSKERAGRSFAEISGTIIFRASARNEILETARPQAVLSFCRFNGVRARRLQQRTSGAAKEKQTPTLNAQHPTSNRGTCGGILETACPQAVFRFIFVRRPHSQDGCASSCVFTCAIQSAKSASSVVVSKKLAIENLQVT